MEWCRIQTNNRTLTMKKVSRLKRLWQEIEYQVDTLSFNLDEKWIPYVKYRYLLIWLRYYYILGPKKKLRLLLHEFHPYLDIEGEMLRFEGINGEYTRLIDRVRQYLHNQDYRHETLNKILKLEASPYPSDTDALKAFFWAFKPSDLSQEAKEPYVYTDID